MPPFACVQLSIPKYAHPTFDEKFSRSRPCYASHQAGDVICGICWSLFHCTSTSRLIFPDHVHDVLKAGPTSQLLTVVVPGGRPRKLIVKVLNRAQVSDTRIKQEIRWLTSERTDDGRRVFSTTSRHFFY